MAGYLTAPIREHHRGNAEATDISRWLIDFARFVPYPHSPSPYPGLVPLGKRELSPSPYGTWLSTSSSKVYLRLVDKVNRSDVILSVELGGKVLEEHYISKLNFAWPQMTCVSGFPPRGSRAVLVSYKDSSNEIQKFALRFTTCDAAVTFVVALKEKLKGSKEAWIQKSETGSEICFESDYNPANEIIPSATEEESNMVNSLGAYVPEMLPRFEYQTEHTLYPPQSATVEEPNRVNHPDSYVPEMLPRFEYQTDQTLRPPHFAIVEEPNMVKHIGGYVPEMQPRLEYQAGQILYPPQSVLSQIPNEPHSNLPPSFTSLLSGCFPNATLDAGQITVKQDPDLKSQILKYMEDSSFQDMLQKVERIIEEIGGNWIA